MFLYRSGVFGSWEIGDSENMEASAAKFVQERSSNSPFDKTVSWKYKRNDNGLFYKDPEIKVHIGKLLKSKYTQHNLST